MLVDALKSGQLKPYLYQQDKINLDKFHQIFSKCFLLFDQTWVEGKVKNNAKIESKIKYLPIFNQERKTGRYHEVFTYFFNIQNKVNRTNAIWINLIQKKLTLFLYSRKVFRIKSSFHSRGEKVCCIPYASSVCCINLAYA